MHVLLWTVSFMAHKLNPNFVHYNPINNWTNMSWNCTAYFSDARALLLTERVIVLCVYAAHACRSIIDQIIATVHILAST